MKEITIIPNNVCSHEMRIVLDDNDLIVSFVAIGGCQGNLRGIGALLKGLTIKDASEKLKGITCHGSRGGLTSCPDQLAIGLEKYMNK